jgi:hypothetical protein
MTNGVPPRPPYDSPRRPGQKEDKTYEIKVSFSLGGKTLLALAVLALGAMIFAGWLVYQFIRDPYFELF